MLKYSSKVLVQIVSCEVKIRTQVSLPPKPKLSPLGQPRMSQRASQAERIALAKAETGDRGGTVRKGSGHRLKHRAPAREQRWEVRVRMERQKLRGGMKSVTDWRGTGGQGSLKQEHPQNWI